MNRIIIGTRGSELALWQAEFIKKQLSSVTDLPVELKIIKTAGDRITDLSFDKIEGKGFFTKEIEEALLAGEVDLAVHSLKDLMTEMPPGLKLAAVGFRADCREAVLIRRDAVDKARPLKIKEGGIIGSSSVRRQCQIAQMDPALELKDLRGNVPTRVNKLREGQYDAIVIAYAGLTRLELDLSDLKVNLMAPADFLPAPAQGILGLQTREDDSATIEIVEKLDDPQARIQVRLERGLLAEFKGGCLLPLGVYSEIEDEALRLIAVLGKKKDGVWSDLARTSVGGDNPEEMVALAYRALTSE